MFEIYDVIENIKQVKENNIIFYAVSKQEIINKDFNRIRKTLRILKDAGKEAKGKLFLTFDGYENDKREIYMIPEIRSFVKNIWEEYRFLFYFLTLFDNNRAIIFACLNNFKVLQNNKEKKCRLEIIYNEEIKNKTINSMKNYGILIDDVDGVQRALLTII
ncbi:MAG: hypothetical protein BHW00_07240 [Clostridium sp. 26_22]|nr:MAG: hypothetical protein BHW00_07240 [Clostridium sp. 26_22]